MKTIDDKTFTACGELITEMMSTYISKAKGIGVPTDYAVRRLMSTCMATLIDGMHRAMLEDHPGATEADADELLMRIAAHHGEAAVQTALSLLAQTPDKTVH